MQINNDATYDFPINAIKVSTRSFSNQQYQRPLACDGTTINLEITPTFPGVHNN